MTQLRKSTLIVSFSLLVFPFVSTFAQEEEAQGSEESVIFRQQKVNGPRLGITYAIHGSDFAEALAEKGIGNFISQFGWHFEFLVAPEGGGPAFVTEILPFLGGVEYNKVLPSLTLALGIRMPMGFEFGMGPNVVFTFQSGKPVSSALVIGVGQTVTFGDVRIPVNVAVLTNRAGQRLSFVVGYAMPRRRQDEKPSRRTGDRRSPWD